jgi:protein associated with RNAse G/E
MIDQTRVVFRKYDGSLHWHATLERLGEDEHGVWLGSWPDTAWRRGDRPPITMGHPQVSVYPHDQWWVAAFNGPPSSLTMYVDISTVPTWSSHDEVTMVDLDLDVIRRRATGEIVIVDEDEFAEHQLRYGYPPDVITAAEASAQWLAAAVGDREPFVSAYQPWLERLGQIVR